MLEPQNLIDLHPVIQFQLKPNITGAFAWDWYWRESTHDGIYAFGSGVLIDPAGTSHARYLGNQGDLEIRWAPKPHIILAFNFAGFEPGTFFKTVTYNPRPSKRMWVLPIASSHQQSRSTQLHKPSHND